MGAKYLLILAFLIGCDGIHCSECDYEGHSKKQMVEHSKRHIKYRAAKKISTYDSYDSEIHGQDRLETGLEIITGRLIRMPPKPRGPKNSAMEKLDQDLSKLERDLKGICKDLGEIQETDKRQREKLDNILRMLKEYESN